MEMQVSRNWNLRITNQEEKGSGTTGEIEGAEGTLSASEDREGNTWPADKGAHSTG